MDRYQNKLRRIALRNKSLFWDIPKNKVKDLSDVAILERILNYGDLSDLRNLLHDIDSFKDVYSRLSSKRNDLKPWADNFAQLYIKNNA